MVYKGNPTRRLPSTREREAIIKEYSDAAGIVHPAYRYKTGSRVACIPHTLYIYIHYMVYKGNPTRISPS